MTVRFGSAAASARLSCGSSAAGRQVRDEQQAAHEMRVELETLHQRIRVVDGLRERDVEHRPRRLVEREPGELRVADDADDAVGADVLRQVEAEMLIERILAVLEEAADERLVDDGDLLRASRCRRR